MQRRTIRTALGSTLAGALTLSALAVAAPAGAKPPSQDPDTPTFTNVTVHDPSVVTSGDDIWVFGSHGASAHTTDLLNWTQNTVDLSQDPQNQLFEDIYEELKETFDWAQSDTLWASDVIELPKGTFAMYYNACKGDSPRSALGLAIAKTVDGPYKDQGILLKSGMWGQESENEGEVYDALKHPNAVDPDAFFDANGKLWMVYGSYSGGIFIVEMDAETGLPIEGQGYGKHLLGGNHSRIEAPVIQYNADTGYYYMYTSFGGLDSTGGYNMRVARSKSPDGPYLDANGVDMATVKSDPTLPLFDDASIEPFGVKLMGSYLFTRELGDERASAGSTSTESSELGVGYVSPGHNSWYEDPQTGQDFLIFHSRFPGLGENHEVRAQQIFFNKDDWPVISPMRYAGETAGKVFRADVEGTWQMVDMGTSINRSVITSQDITLEKNGKISGAVTGKWKLTSQHDAELTIDGTSYEGVFTPIWDPQFEEWSTGFSVLSDEGRALLGRQVEVLGAKEAVNAVADAIDLGNTTQVTGNLTLPVTGTSGTTITWASSDPAAVRTDGSVTRPAVGEPSATATLTATITNGSYSVTRTFSLTVLPRTAGVLGAQWSFEGDLAEATGTQAEGAPTGTRLDQAGAPARFVTDGVKGQALSLDGKSGVKLPDGLISSDTYSVGMWLRPEELTSYTSAFFGAATTESWVSIVPRGHDGVGGNAMVWSGTTWYDAGSGVNLPIGDWSHFMLVVDKGAIEVYVNGALGFSGSGFPDVFTGATSQFGIGVNWWDAPFQGSVDELTVWDSALSPQDVAALAAR